MRTTEEFKSRLKLDLDDFDILMFIQDFLSSKYHNNSLITLYDDFYNDMFYEYMEYTINDILDFLKLNIDKISFLNLNKALDINYLHKCLTILLIEGKIVMNDVIGADNTYKIVAKHLFDSSYTKNYYNISMKNPGRILLISDTHIGNTEMEDFSLIQGVFKYAKEYRGIDSAIHLGDVFQGIRFDKGKYEGYNFNSLEIRNTLDEQIDKFEKYFPDYMKVIAIAGNHDKNIINYLRNLYIVGYPIKQYSLSIIKQNFHLLIERARGYIITYNNIRIGLSHPLCFNELLPYVKTTDIYVNSNTGETCLKNSFVNDFRKYNFDDIDLYLSGHLHVSGHHYIHDDNPYTKRNIEIIPSLSKLAYNTSDNCVAKILDFIYDEDNNISYYEITPLFVIQGKFIEGNKVLYPTNSELLKVKKRNL